MARPVCRSFTRARIAFQTNFGAVALVALVQVGSPTPPAPLQIRADGQWLTWRRFTPGDSASLDSLLPRAITWIEQQAGLRLGTFEIRTEGRPWENSVALLELDPTHYRFELDAAANWERRLVAEWMRDSSIVAAMNTGLFRDDGTPFGLVVIGGTRRNPPTGWLDALVSIEHGTPRLHDVRREASADSGWFAFQTLPWLVRGGRVVFSVSSGARMSRTHRDRRLTLCLGADRFVRILLSNFEAFGRNVGVIPIGLTIPEQATIAGAMGCTDAVALDGGISAQLFVRGTRTLHRMPGWRKVPLVMLVRRR